MAGRGGTSAIENHQSVFWLASLFRCFGKSRAKGPVRSDCPFAINEAPGRAAATETPGRAGSWAWRRDATITACRGTRQPRG